MTRNINVDTVFRSRARLQAAPRSFSSLKGALYHHPMVRTKGQAGATEWHWSPFHVGAGLASAAGFILRPMFQRGREASPVSDVNARITAGLLCAEQMNIRCLRADKQYRPSRGDAGIDL